MVLRLGSGSVSRSRPFASRYSVTPSSDSTLRGASAAAAQTAHSSKVTANSRFILRNRKALPRPRRPLKAQRCKDVGTPEFCRRPEGALFLLLATLLRFLGARLALGRIFRLRAHLVAHAVAVRVALLAFAGLPGFITRRLHLLAALLAALGVLRFRAIETLAFACVGLRSLGIKGSAGREQAGTEEGDRQFHKRVLSRGIPLAQRAFLAAADRRGVTLCITPAA